MSCPHCGRTLTAHEHVGPSHHVPDPGDVTVCGYCGAASMFDTVPAAAGGGLTLRAPTEAEAALIATDPDVAAAVQGYTAHPGDGPAAVARARRTRLERS